MFSVKLNQAKSMFFDRQRVQSAADRATRRVLGRFGAFVRRRSRSSIRRKRRSSSPGRPPASHTGVLRDYIFFGYDPKRRSVVIGPAKANIVYFRKDGQPTTGTAAEVLEHGGDIYVLEVNKYGRWQRADLRSRRRNEGLATRMRRVPVSARPYMGPAFEKEKAGLDKLWKDSVR